MLKGYQNRSTPFFGFCDDFYNICTTPAEGILNSCTAHNGEAVNCYLRFVLFDGCERECRCEKFSMKV